MQSTWWNICLSATLLTSRILPSVGAESVTLKSSRLPSLPDPLGVAAPFAGVTGGALLVAGGANFPNGFPWAGGKKVWHDSAWLLSDKTGAWKNIGKLPRPLAYGVSITTPDGIVCIGGGDAEKHYADCFLLTVGDGAVRTKKIPGLPVPLAFAAGALVGKTIFIAGGAEQPGEQSASREFYSLNLGATESGWKKLPPCPGPARILPVAAAVGGDFFLVGGAALEKTNGAVARVYLRDAWRYRTAEGWEKIPDVPRFCVAAPSPAPVAGSSFFVLGGDDGSLRDFKPVEKHPGFPKKIQACDVATGAWRDAGELPAARVTTTVVFWKNSFVVPSGEARPGVRSPEVWSLVFSDKR